MDFINDQTIDASFSTFNFVHGNQMNIANHIVRPGALHWLRETIAQGALYDSRDSPSPCSPGTREGIMGLISDWVSGPNNQCVCSLSGHVGTGKSAIAKTISQQCNSEGLLAATFFCSRAASDRSYGKGLVATIAYQLAASLPHLDDAIRDEIEAKPLILTKRIPDQFQALIVDPLLRNRSTLPRQVVVMDALDEYDEKSAMEIARLTSDMTSTYDLPIRFFITSRPASHIHLSFAHSSIGSLQLRNFDVRRHPGIPFPSSFVLDKSSNPISRYSSFPASPYKPILSSFCLLALSPG